jgi:hypothetical protein
LDVSTFGPDILNRTQPLLLALAAEHLTLAPNSATKSHLSGRMVPQSGPDLDKMGVLFSNFLAGKNQTLITKGRSVQPDGSDGSVGWLSEAFKTLELEVVLPGEKLLSNLLRWRISTL